LTGSLVVKAHRPGRTALFLVAGLIVIAALSAGLFELGQIRGGFNRERASQEQALQTQQIQEFDRQNQLLRERVALLEESGRIDREAATQLTTTLEAQDREIGDLRQELAFYRGIISPADGRAGLRLQGVSLAPQAGGTLSYELVLVQALRHDRNQTGQVRISISGTDAAGPRTLALQDLTAEADASIPYTFRYFLKLTGELRLPEGFDPEEVRVTLDPSASGQPNVEQSFGWTELTRGP
jgi:uncharacterized protein DUF6776